MDKQGNKRVHKDKPSTSHAPTKKKKTHSIKQKMDTGLLKTNKGNKRSHEHETPCTSHGTPKKRKQQCPSTEEMGDGKDEVKMKNFKNAQNILSKVLCEINNEPETASNKKLLEYIRDSILRLNGFKKKITVGLFGKTGDGKSSLINAILGEKHLLPSGTGSACTSVIIQVTANKNDYEYSAMIEFISKEDWECEFQSFLSSLESVGVKDEEELNAAKEKIKALYGAKASSLNPEELREREKFLKIGALVKSKKTEITFQNASQLSTQITKYVCHNNSSEGGYYWPIVKIVTIKVPHCKDFLEHVVLVDLPGTGDCNKIRDQMWKMKLQKCSSVWIVSDINRADSDKLAWDILSTNITNMAQGGECRSISFICTKSDQIDPEEYIHNEQSISPLLEGNHSEDEIKIECIKHRNRKSKKRVLKSFGVQTRIKKNFNCGDDFFSVFTVSSKEFTKQNPLLDKDQTEIPALQKVLKKYNNNCTSDIEKYYISGTFGIVSLIQSFSGTEMITEKSTLQSIMNSILEKQVEILYNCCDDVYGFLEKHLSIGATKSEEKCIETAKAQTPPKNRNGYRAYQTLASLCRGDGRCKSKNFGTLDLNECLAKPMYDCIDTRFNHIFSAQEEEEIETSLQKHIDKFTIISDEMNEKFLNTSASHFANFFKMQEKNLKEKIKTDVVDKKKKMWASLAESIKTTMMPAYQKAAAISGPGSMQKKQNILLRHIESSKSEMFQKAKTEMLKLVKMMKFYTADEMKRILKQDYSLLSEDTLLSMDVHEELEELKLMDEVNEILQNMRKFVKIK